MSLVDVRTPMTAPLASFSGESVVWNQPSLPPGPIVEYSTIGPGGKEGWFHTTLSPENDANGAVIGVLTSTRDITANKAAERALAHQAMHDSLTGLPNRYLLMDRLSRALVRMERAPGRVVLYFVDIDHFKSINDTYGHDAGDRVRVELSASVGAAVADDTTVNAADLLHNADAATLLDPVHGRIGVVQQVRSVD